jgi:holo-[acyl-carrier protein] synthase
VIHGIGTDIVKIDRIRRSLDRYGEKFARRILTTAEFIEYQNSRQPARFVAKRFAVKEAVAKALGFGFRGGLAPNSIGVSHDKYGKPLIVYEGKARDSIREAGISQSLVSISDEQDYAMAFVILLGGQEQSPIPGVG